MNPKKIALAYSGGLDTSIIIPWLKETYPGCEVVAVCGDVGQGEVHVVAAEQEVLADRHALEREVSLFFLDRDQRQVGRPAAHVEHELRRRAAGDLALEEVVHGGGVPSLRQVEGWF